MSTINNATPTEHVDSASAEQTKVPFMTRAKQFVKNLFTLNTLRVALRAVTLILLAIIMAVPAGAAMVVTSIFMGPKAGVFAGVAAAVATHLVIGAFYKKFEELLGYVTSKVDQFVDYLGRRKAKAETEPVAQAAAAA